MMTLHRGFIDPSHMRRSIPRNVDGTSVPMLGISDLVDNRFDRSIVSLRKLLEHGFDKCADAAS